MAPVTASSAGVARQTIDDPALRNLINSLSAFDGQPSEEKTLNNPLVSNEIDVPGLVDVLKCFPSWRFQEQADLFEWIRALNVIDTAIAQLLLKNPSLILIAKRKEGKEEQAECVEDVVSVPDHVVSHLCAILRFLCSLLRNATSKSVFNSVDHLIDLLAAADDQLASLALEALSNLSSPPMMHRQQEPQQLSQQNTALHLVRPGAHSRILSLARGWGSRGSGLGLYTCVTADDSPTGQGALPQEAGELFFQYFDHSSNLITIQLNSYQILDSDTSKPKPTYELFFNCLKQAGGRSCITKDKAFSLLAHVRLSRSFYSNATRIASVQHRLMALKCFLLSNPSSEVIAGYFHAQPELCGEIVDLVRPTISSTATSSVPLSNASSHHIREGAISAVADSNTIPYTLRTLAIETLTSLVTKKDGSGSGLTPVARQINILAELGVGKGQYLGFLPTLIRYTLASLNTFLTHSHSDTNKTEDAMDEESSNEDDDVALELGMAFLKATKPASLPYNVLEERALEFIDAVLTLTSAVVSVPSGTAALTDCGLIPALISTVALDTHVANNENSHEEESYSNILLKFITAQAIQILEGAIVTQSNALSAFHDLHGVDLLISRLHQEINRIKNEGSTSMETDDVSPGFVSRPFRSAKRVLLFSILNCLTIVFHQQETTTTTSSSGAQLRKPELTSSLIEILDNVSLYGGVLAALTATLLADVMNSDPQVVHHVHSSGLAKSFLNMIMCNDKNIDENDLSTWNTLFLPPAPEFIMHIPNVIQALALTEEGVKVVSKLNPFPSLLSIFYNSQYAMPNSRCLLNEMTAIVGTSLDEMMRHVPVLRPLGIKALLAAVRRILKFAQALVSREASNEESINLINDRTYLIQYSYNICQLLEQVLHNEEHSNPFVESGGVTLLLELQPHLMPYHKQFLSHMSCLSTPAAANLTHSTTAQAVASTIKSIASHFDAHKMIRTIVNSIAKNLTLLDESRSALVKITRGTDLGFLRCEKILESIPRLPLHQLDISERDELITQALSKFLQNVVVIEWHTSVLVSVIRSASQKSHEMGNSWGNSDRELWKKEIASDAFVEMLFNLSLLYRSTMFEACHIRVEDGYDEREANRRMKRSSGPVSWYPETYSLRIVCQEGAVVRDGIEIDLCAPVGGLEMGEIVLAFDRCINSSGVMRYKTEKGWVSEQTRGHGREPIAEVISIAGFSSSCNDSDQNSSNTRRIESGVFDLASASASVLSRLHNSQKNIFSCLSRLVIQGLRTVPMRNLSLPQGLISSHIGGMLRMISQNLLKMIELPKENINNKQVKYNDYGIALYLGNALELLHLCLYEEKRERRVLNTPLLVSILGNDTNNSNFSIFSRFDSDAFEQTNDFTPSVTKLSVFNAIYFVFKFCLQDMAIEAAKRLKSEKKSESKGNINKKRLSRAAASSLPSAIALLRRLATRNLIVESQISSMLSRLKADDISMLFGEKVQKKIEYRNIVSQFIPSRFALSVHCAVADILTSIWLDTRLLCSPAFVINPILSLVNDIIVSLEECIKANGSGDGIASLSARNSRTDTSRSEGSQRELSDVHERLSRSISAMSYLFGGGSGATSSSAAEEGGRYLFGARTTFEPSESTIERLLEMGFSRDHALDALESTESNRLEVAMEYALAHPPPSPTTIERRRAARDERRRQREALLAGWQRNQGAQRSQESSTTIPSGAPSENANNTDSSALPVTMQESSSPNSGIAPTGSEEMELDASMTSETITTQNLRTDDNPTSTNVSTKTRTQSKRKDDQKKIKVLQEEEQRKMQEVHAAKVCLETLQHEIIPISIKLIEEGTYGLDLDSFSLIQGLPEQDFLKGNNFIDEDANVLTSVVSSFLLDTFKKSHGDYKLAVYTLLLRMKLYLKIGKEDTCIGIISGCESKFASLCHAAVIMLHAFPTARILVLHLGLLNLLIGCLNRFTKNASNSFYWPRWISPAILLLDVMAKPTGISLELQENEFSREIKDKSLNFSDEKGELARVAATRMKQGECLKKTSNNIMKILFNSALEEKETQTEKGSDSESQPKIGDQKLVSTITSLPLHIPLIPPEEMEICLPLCLDILRLRSKDAKDKGVPSSSLVQAILLLLARILRSSKMSIYCLRLGGPEVILSLPFKSRFNGLAGLVTVVFRHMLEDENTLRIAMETEIRGIVMRLNKQQNRLSSSSTEKAKISAKSFIESVTPLICRDAITFLKAAVTSISINIDSESSPAQVVLLSSDERSKKLKKLSDILCSSNNTSIHPIPGLGRRSLSVGSKITSKSNIMPLSSTPSLKRHRSTSATSSRHHPKTKLNHPLSTTKRGSTPKKLRKEKSDRSISTHRSTNPALLNGNPSNHVISLLFTELVSANTHTINENSIKYVPTKFFTIIDLLEILADLVLSFPACAAAIHRYRLSQSAMNACISGLPVLAGSDTATSTCTGVSYLLNFLLPQSRSIPKSHPDSMLVDDPWLEKKTEESESKRSKKIACFKIKVAQSTARLLVALCARAGESRKRVIAELMTALIMKSKEEKYRADIQNPSHLADFKKQEMELWAIRSWAEICFGLAAPKGNGSSQDSNSFLSFDIIKVMYEHGVAHALMNGMRRINLCHPMASSVCASLLRPIEIVTRGSVVDAVNELVKIEIAQKKNTPDAKGSSARKSLSSTRTEGNFNDDAMIEDGFEPAVRRSRTARGENLGHVVERMVRLGEFDYDEYEAEAMDEMTEVVHDVEMEADDNEAMHDVVESEEDEDSESGEGTIESDTDESSEVSNQDDEEMDDAEGEGSPDDEEDEEDSEDDEDPLDEEGELFSWGEDDDRFVAGNSTNNADEGEDTITLHALPSEAELEEGWTRIDSSSFGGILFGTRSSNGNLTDSNVNRNVTRARGFVLDAAEAMIGNILRGSDVQLETLAEIEDTLGIRIMHNSRNSADHEQRGSSGFLGVPIGSGHSRSATNTSSSRSSIGYVPYVNQSNALDNSLIVRGGTGRIQDLSYMEFVFGSLEDDNSEEDDDNLNFIVVPSTIDPHLFPDGTAASTHSRTQHCLHPLLSGVDLPPVYSQRTTHQTLGERSGSSRNSEGRGTEISISALAGGNVIRLNRSPNGSPFLEHHWSRGGNVSSISNDESRWTEDGQPLEPTSRDFASAFERILESFSRNNENQTETMSTVEAEINQNNISLEGRSGGEEQASSSTEIQHGIDTNQQETNETAPSALSDARTSNSQPNNDSCNTELRSGNTNVTMTRSNILTFDLPASENQVVPDSSGANVCNDSNTSEGEGVANSLATGLRLSPESESSNRFESNTNSRCEPSNREQSNLELLNQNDSTTRPSAEGQHGTSEEASASAVVPMGQPSATSTPNEYGLVCPPGMDAEVFDSLPVDMQREVVEQHRATMMVSEELGSMSSLDPEALVALPEDMRREIIAQEQQNRRTQQEQQADPSNAEEMDNASFVASLAPELREEILITADDTFLSSLPPDIIAEAQILRERASSGLRRGHEEVPGQSGAQTTSSPAILTNSATASNSARPMNNASHNSNANVGRRRNRTGRVRVDCDRANILYTPSNIEQEYGALLSPSSMRLLMKLFFLISPIRPQRLIPKIIQNLCSNAELRKKFLVVFVSILNNDTSTLTKLNITHSDSSEKSVWNLIGIAPDITETDFQNSNLRILRSRPEHTQVGAAAIAANLPANAKGTHDELIPTVAARRIVECFGYLSKNSPRVCLDSLVCINQFGIEHAMVFQNGLSCLDKILDLLSKPLYSKSSTNLEQILSLLENIVGPLSVLPKDEESESNKIDTISEGKEWVNVPRVQVTPTRLKLLCSVLRFESCKDTCFQKVNIITRRLCRVGENKSLILRELASVAQDLGVDAIRDLRLLSIRLNDAAKVYQELFLSKGIDSNQSEDEERKSRPILRGIPGSAVTMSTSSSELKLLRVLQTLHILCTDTNVDDGKKFETQLVSHELVDILKAIDLESLWDELTSCLKIVSVLEGVSDEVDTDDLADNIEENKPISSEPAEIDNSEQNTSSGKKLKNSVAGLLSRFLPTIEAFFVVNASSFGDRDNQNASSSPDAIQTANSTEEVSLTKENTSKESNLSALVGGQRLIKFVAANGVLLNALLRANPSLLEKALRAMVQVPQCRPFLDFDVKRLWFKTQVRRLRQHASRRHGNLRLNIRRKHVFEDAYHQLRLRTADEMRGRLHITFRNEEGVDAGGLSREFFAILAKEMFNPNYALFTSTEDGCTFQPNPNSSINPDHLSYFRFVGRIVGKAVLDGFLLDAHFTRSLYKHMLGIKPTYHDMQAIDPDYYKNLKMILEYNLDDIGLDHLTFSTEDHSFGRINTIDLIPNGRNTTVNETNKEAYVNLVCNYRMSSSIKKQIKAYLDGFYELVKPELISVFTAKELELLISGMPDIDILDLQRNTEYQGYKPSDKEIGWFWNIMFSLSKSEKALFIQFVTGSSKVPLEGFSQLQGMRGTQKFSIHKAGGQAGALMSAHTCFNALDLPLYKSEDEMREKLIFAIREGGGAFLFV